MNSQQNIKIFTKMSRWLKSLNLDKESYNHTLYSLYMTKSYINSRNINHDVIYIIQLNRRWLFEKNSPSAIHSNHSYSIEKSINP